MCAVSQVRAQPRAGIDRRANLVRVGAGVSDGALFVDGAEVNKNFKLALSNIPNVDVLPSQGLNVYDILRRDVLVMTTGSPTQVESFDNVNPATV